MKTNIVEVNVDGNPHRFVNKYYNSLKKLTTKTFCSLARHFFSNVAYINTSNSRALVSPTFVPSSMLLSNESMLGMENLFQTSCSSVKDLSLYSR
ncbi:hypothetical protein DPMN_005929 [Dreissena polymorpha]|uniref:Uncharacterized protein n=1 Tax=Dreissena polymorpha TaxID=45954 RepID=A0A9D4RWY6_DREPO|nr:hypothetical protein DPMN_005929 [Dreissena polymorpha]